MNIFKRKDGRSPFWFVDMVNPRTGKRVRKSTGQTDRRAAMRWALEQTSKEAERETTVGAAIDAYIQRMKADGLRSHADAALKSDKTIGRGGEARWGTRFRLDPELPLSELTAKDVQALKAARATEGNAPGTIAAELRILRAACKLAEDTGYQGPKVRKWGVPPPDHKLRYLSPDEAKAVLHKLHPDTPVTAGTKGKLVVPRGVIREGRQDVHDLFLALVMTGGRWAEVGKLTWRQVNFEAGTITLWGWKSAKERTVPMVPEVAEMLRRRFDYKRGAYVFPGRDGKARRAPSRAISRAIDAVGLNAPEIVEAFGRATIHSLRHTYASWLRQAGLGLDEIQPLLGHADMQTTKIYAKVVDASTFEKARAALGVKLAHSRHTEPGG